MNENIISNQYKKEEKHTGKKVVRKLRASTNKYVLEGRGRECNDAEYEEGEEGEEEEGEESIEVVCVCLIYNYLESVFTLSLACGEIP